MISNTVTSVTYAGTGSQTIFAFPFDYLRKSYVTIQVDYVSLEYDVDYSVHDKEVTFVVAPAEGAIIDIVRATDSTPLVSWVDASVLKSSDMTINQMQELHILEEMKTYLYDGKFTFDENDTSAWNALNARIKNLVDPVDAQDAVTKGYIESVKVGFISSMTTTASTCIASLNTKSTEVLASLSSGLTSALASITTLKTTCLSAITTLKDSCLTTLTTFSDDAIATMTTLKEACSAFATSASTSASAAALSALSVDSAAISASIATKAPIASPTFTGVPKVPTASYGDNSQTIANTEFLATALSAIRAGNTVSVTTGTLASGATIPLPSGYTREQCKYMVSMNDYEEKGDNNKFVCSVSSTGVVTCYISWYDSKNNWHETSHTADYICIAISSEDNSIYTNQAAASAILAQEAVADAVEAEEVATTQATIATTQASLATASASEASTYADNASASTSLAETHATSASGYSEQAGTYATNASNSEANAQAQSEYASGYATQAGTYATNASGYATTATEQATTATEQATIATNYANSIIYDIDGGNAQPNTQIILYGGNANG